MIADLDDLFTALYVFADEFLPRRRRARRRPPISDAELVCLAVAQISPRLPLGRTFTRADWNDALPGRHYAPASRTSWSRFAAFAASSARRSSSNGS